MFKILLLKQYPSVRLLIPALDQIIFFRFENTVDIFQIFLGFTGFYARQYDESIAVFSLDPDSFRSIAWIGFATWGSEPRIEWFDLEGAD